MSSFHKLITLSAALLLAVPVASAAAPPKADEHAGHGKAGATSTSLPAPDERMQAMREMRDKMAAARTPEERQALMAAHMKTMHDGMQMMSGMSGMSGMGGTGGPGGKSPMGAKAGAKAMPAEMARHHQMMEGRMDMMQTMMEMMMQRMPVASADGK